MAGPRRVRKACRIKGPSVEYVAQKALARNAAFLILKFIHK